MKYGKGLLAALDYLGGVHLFDLKKKKKIGIGRFNDSDILDFCVMSPIIMTVARTNQYEVCLKSIQIEIVDGFNSLQSSKVFHSSQDYSGKFRIFYFGNSNFLFGNDRNFLILDSKMSPSIILSISNTLVNRDWDKIEVLSVKEKDKIVISVLERESKHFIRIWNLCKTRERWKDYIALTIAVPGRPAIAKIHRNQIIYDENGILTFYDLQSLQVSRKFCDFKLSVHNPMICCKDFLITGIGSVIYYLDSKTEIVESVEQKHRRNIHSLQFLDESEYSDEKEEEIFPQSKFFVSCGFDSEVNLWKIIFESHKDVILRLNELSGKEFCEEQRISFLEIMFKEIGEMRLIIPSLFLFF